jgi:hypothetical protein
MIYQTRRFFTNTTSFGNKRIFYTPFLFIKFYNDTDVEAYNNTLIGYYTEKQITTIIHEVLQHKEHKENTTIKIIEYPTNIS